VLAVRPDRRLERCVAVARNGDVERAIFDQNRRVGIAVAAVPGPSSGVAILVTQALAQLWKTILGAKRIGGIRWLIAVARPEAKTRTVPPIFPIRAG